VRLLWRWAWIFWQLLAYFSSKVEKCHKRLTGNVKGDCFLREMKPSYPLVPVRRRKERFLKNHWWHLFYLKNIHRQRKLSYKQHNWNVKVLKTLHTPWRDSNRYKGGCNVTGRNQGAKRKLWIYKEYICIIECMSTCRSMNTQFHLNCQRWVGKVTPLTLPSTLVTSDINLNNIIFIPVKCQMFSFNNNTT
jgi:hypothetical protein